MRTTVDIPDDLYRATKILAAERGTTVRELVLEGLEIVRARKAIRAGLGSPAAPHAELGSRELNCETNDEMIGFP